jgi:hypothetical protein
MNKICKKISTRVKVVVGSDSGMAKIEILIRIGLKTMAVHNRVLFISFIMVKGGGGGANPIYSTNSVDYFTYYSSREHLCSTGYQHA